MHPVLKNKRQPFGAGNRNFDSDGSSPKWLLFLGKNSNVGQGNEVDQIRLNSYSAFIDISTTCL